MKRTHGGLLCLSVVMAGCAEVWVDGPSRPLIRDVSSIVVTDRLEDGRVTEITDPAQIEQVLLSPAFSKRWRKDDRNPRDFESPFYRVDVHAEDGTVATYWIGLLWIVPLTRDAPYGSLLKGMTSGQYQALMRALGTTDPRQPVSKK